MQENGQENGKLHWQEKQTEPEQQALRIAAGSSSQLTFEGCFTDATTDAESRHNRKISVKHRMLSEGRYEMARLNRENL